MAIVIEEVTAEVAAEAAQSEAEEPAAALPSPQLQMERQLRMLRRLEARKARLKAD